MLAPWPPLKALTMGTRASELDHRATEEGDLVVYVKYTWYQDAPWEESKSQHDAMCIFRSDTSGPAVLL